MTRRRGTWYGDFSRVPDPPPDTTGLLLQQGRVQLDADWNAQFVVGRDQLISLAHDLLGLGAGPAGGAGFAIRPVVGVAIGEDAALTVEGTEELTAAPGAVIELTVRADGSGTLLDAATPDGTAGWRLAVDDRGGLVLGMATTSGRFDIHVAESGLGSPPWPRFARVAVQLASDNVTLTVDGRRVAHIAIVGPPPLAAVPLTVGGRAGEGAIALVGELRAWRDEEPYGHWPLEEGTGVFAADTLGGHPARMTAGASWRLVDLEVGAGRYYVGGVGFRQPAPYSLSSRGRLPDTPGRHLVYVEIWERSVSAVEDPALREVALGGLDTVVRTETVAAVRHVPVPLGADPAALLSAAPTGTMSAEHRGLVQPGNALYRVEVRRGGATGEDPPPTVTWSRSNGSTVVALAARDRGSATVSLLPASPDLAPGTLVEYLDARYTAAGRRGPLRRVESVTATTVTLDTEPPDGLGTDPSTRPFLRVWDGVARVGAGEPLLLEDGVEVAFGAGTYTSGDYWWVPTRTDAGVLWPDEHGHPVARPPHGVERLRAPLAYVELGESVTVKDLRTTFAPAGAAPGEAEPPEPVHDDRVQRVQAQSAAPRVVVPAVPSGPEGGVMLVRAGGRMPNGWTGTGQFLSATTRWSPPRPFGPTIGKLAALVPYQGDLVLVTTSEVWLVPGGDEPAQRLGALPVPREGFGCFVTDGALYVAGGRARGARPDGALLRYELEADNWADAQAMPHPVCDAVVAFARGRAHVVGGHRPGWLLARAARHHQVYDVASDRWTGGQRLPRGRYAAASAITPDRLHVLGGISRRGLGRLSARADHVVLDLATGDWSLGVPLPEPCAWAAAAVDGEARLVVAGGAQGAEWKDRVLVNGSGQRVWHRADPLAAAAPCRAAVTTDGAVLVVSDTDVEVTGQWLPAPVTYEVLQHG